MFNLYFWNCSHAIPLQRDLVFTKIIILLYLPGLNLMEGELTIEQFKLACTCLKLACICF